MNLFKLNNKQNDIVDLESKINKLRALSSAYESVVELQDLHHTLSDIFIEIEHSLNYQSSLLIVNKEKDRLEAFDINSNTMKLLKPFIPKDKIPFNVPLNYENLEDMGLAVKAYHSNRIIRSNSMYEIIKPLLGRKISNGVQLITRIKHGIVVPVRSKGHTIAVLTAGSKNEILKFDEDLLISFANLAGLAISNSKLFTQVNNQVAQLTQQNQELSSLYQLTSAVGSTLRALTVAETAAKTIPQDENMIGTFISLYEPEKNSLVPVAYSKNDLAQKAESLIGDMSKYSTNIDSGKDNIAVKAFLDKEMKYTTELSDFTKPALPDKFIKPISKLLNIKSLLVQPIMIRGKVFGTITYFLRNSTYEELTENRKQLYQTYTNQIAIALDNAHLYEESEETKRQLGTALNQVQEARRRERDMIDIMGHELRTPISIVKNALSFMDLQIKEHGSLTNEQINKYVAMGLESARREADLIETMLSATKADAKGFDLNFEKVDLNDVVNDSFTAHKDPGVKKGLEVIFEPDQQYYVYCDRTRIQEISDNFISNAIKYTKEGFVKVYFKKKDGLVWTVVEDTGIGIDKSEIESLGKKFFRAHQHISNIKGEEGIVRPGGTGLGLYVSFALAKLMDGDYKVESEIGKGSKFSFGIPDYTGQVTRSVQRKLQDYVKVTDSE